MANVPLSTDVPRIYPPSFSVPEISKARIYRAEIDVPGRSVVQPNITRRRDHADDLSDLILGHPISGTRELRNLLDDNDVGAIGSIPLLNRIVGAGLLIKERALDPIAEGDIDVALVNSLETFGKSLDILANPVKSLMPWAGGGSSTDLLKSMGWLDGAYREEYQWDTGNFLVDLAGEIVSDPLTFLTFSSSSISKTAIKEAVDVTSDALIRTVGKEIASEIPTVLKQDIVLKAGSEILNESSDVVKQLFKNIDDQYKTLQYLVEGSPKLLQQKEITDLLQRYRRTLSMKGKKEIIDAIADLRYTNAYKKYLAASKWKTAVNTVDANITKAALITTPLFGSGYVATKYWAIPGFKHLYRKAIAQLKEVDTVKLLNNSPGVLKDIANRITLNNSKLNQETINKFKNILDTYDYDLDKLQNVWRSLYRSQGTTATVERTNKLFLKELKKNIPILRDVGVSKLNEKSVNELIAKVSNQDISDLVDVVSQGGIVLINVEDSLTKQYKEAIELQMEKYFTNKGTPIKAGTTFENYTMYQQLNFINNRLLTYNGRRYGLKNLAEYLRILNNDNPELYTQVASLLNYTGITLDNYKEVYRLAKLKTKEASTQLKDLLISSKTDSLFNVKETKKALSKQLNYAKYTMPKIPLDVETDLDKDIIEFFNKHSTEYTKQIGQELTKITSINDIYNVIEDIKTTIDTLLETQHTMLDNIRRMLDTFYELADNSLLNKHNAVLKEVQDLLKTGSKKDTQKAYELLLKLQQDTNINLLPVNDQLNSVYDLLDNLYTNADPDLLETPNSTVLKNVIEFNLESELKEESIKLFKDNLQELQRRVIGWKNQIDTSNIVNNYTLNSYEIGIIKDLYNVVNKKETTKLVVDLNDLLNTGQDYIRLIVSAQNRYAHINAAISTSDVLDYYKELSNIDSKARLNLQEVTRKLDDIASTSTPNYSKYINRILAKIDCNNAIASLVNTSLTNYEIPKEVTRYMQGMFINILDANKKELAVKYYKNTKELTTRFMQQFIKDNEKILYDYFASNPRSIVEDTIMQDELDRLTRKLYNEGLTDAEEIDYEYLKSLGEDIVQRRILTTDEVYNGFITELEDSVDYAFKVYVDRLKEIGRINNMPVKFYNVFDYSAVADMNHLGLSYPQVIDALTKANADDVAIFEARKFIENLAGDRIKQTKSEFIDYIDQLKESGVISIEAIGYLTQDIMDTPQQTLSNALVDAFRNIDKIMDDLGGADATIGKVLSDGEYSKKIKNVVKYVTVQDFNEFLRAHSQYRNMYSASTASGVLGFRKDIKGVDVVNRRLSSEYIKASDEVQYLMLYNSLNNSYKRVDRYLVKDKKYIEDIRYSLIKVYSSYNTGFGPIKPKEYFLEASTNDLLAWDITTKSRLLDINTSNEYKSILYNRTHPEISVKENLRSITEKVSYYQDPSKVFADIDDAVTKAPLLNEDEIVNLYETIPTINLPDLYLGIEQSFKTRLKDVESLKLYEGWFTERISNDVDAINRLKVLDNIRNNNTTVNKVVTNKKDLRILASYGIKPTTKISDNKVLTFLTRERVNALNESIKSWNAKQLYSYISDNTDGVLFYVDDTGLFNFKYTPEELEEAGLTIANLSDDKNIFVIRRLSDKYAKVPYEYLNPRYIFKQQQDIITNLFKQNRNYFYWDGMTVPDELYSGTIMNEDYYNIIKSHPSIQKIIGDNAGRKLYSNSTKKGLSNFYKKSIRPDVVIVGSYDGFNRLLELCKNEFLARNIEATPTALDITKRAWKANMTSIQRVNSMNKYLQLFMNDDFALGGSVFKPILSKASDAEIADLFKRNSYTAAIIRSDRKGRPRVYKIFVENKKQLQDAIEAKAVILPHEVYRNAVLSINKQQLDNKLINLYRRTIVGTYKSIYLTSPGFLVRNYLDSSVYRNNAEYQGLVGMFDMFKYEAKASKMLDWYNSIHKEVFNLANGKTFNRKNLRRVLANLTEEQRQIYFTIDMFMNSGASGGLSQEFEKFLLAYNKANSESLTYAWAQYWNENVIDNPIFKAVRETNNKIEQSSRFGLFLALLDQDLGYSEAIRRVINTHFDYELKENGLDILEQIFWFSTFPINNTLYFINDGLTRNPDMLKSYMDALELSYNDSDNYTWDDVRNSDYLTYNALTGNIRFYLFGNDSDDPTSRLLLKTGSSVLDFFNIIANPLGEATERINPFLSVLLGITPPSDLNPFNAYGSKVENIVTGRSYIPSVYATLYPVYRKENKYKIPKRPYVKSSWTGIRKPRTIYPKRPKSQKYMSYRFSTDKYYFYQKENVHRWRITTRNKIPHTYNETNQTLTPIGRYTYDNKKFARAVKKLRMTKN